MIHFMHSHGLGGTSLASPEAREVCMQTVLGGYSEAIYAVLRLVTGLLFACHGAQKLFGVLGGFGGTPGATAPLASLMGVGGLIELVGGLMIALGLFAGPAAFVCSGEMAVAYFMAHASHGFWPILNKGELAVVYCFLFLYIASRGSGRFSLEAAMRRGPSR
jgi:putative oxidoreductase